MKNYYNNTVCDKNLKISIRWRMYSSEVVRHSRREIFITNTEFSQ